MAELVVRDLQKRFGTVRAVDNISFHVADGEFVTLLGPSGCGKSTTLAAIAGLDTPDAGFIRAGTNVFFDGASGHNLPTEMRNCGLVFQSYALWPHMTVRDNIAFPLKLRGVAARERDDRIEKVSTLVEMMPYLDRFPHQLSGGQQQRVALARTLVYEPAVLLLDEPLSNLDSKLRERARTWLSELQQTVAITTIYVTHDQAEALALSDRIAVMNQGRIVQIGTPHEIYRKPADPFVASFIGTSSFLHGRLVATDATGDGVIVLTGGQEIRVRLGREIVTGADVTVAVRSEKLQLFPESSPAPEGRGTALRARVISRSYLGARWYYELGLGDIVLKVETPEDCDAAELMAWIPAAECVVFEASGAMSSRDHE